MTTSQKSKSNAKKKKAHDRKAPPNPIVEVWKKRILLVFLAMVVFVGIAVGLQRLMTRHLRISRPVQTIAVSTNGILSESWIYQKLNLPTSIDLNEVNVQQLRERFLQENSIADATIERIYPSTLKVSLIEYIPAFRIRHANSKLVSYVAHDGTIFEYPEGISPQERTLPYLEGLETFHCGEKVPFIFELNRFYQTARQTHPELVEQWKVFAVDAKDYELTGRLSTIEVRTENVKHILFRTSDVFQQLDELTYLLVEAHQKRMLPLLKIDLTVPNRAYVKPYKP